MEYKFIIRIKDKFSFVSYSNSIDLHIKDPQHIFSSYSWETRKLGRCDSYLRNHSPTHLISHLKNGTGIFFASMRLWVCLKNVEFLPAQTFRQEETGISDASILHFSCNVAAAAETVLYSCYIHELILNNQIFKGKTNNVSAI